MGYILLNILFLVSRVLASLIFLSLFHGKQGSTFGFGI
jgi:hypothetical protein